MPILAIAAVAGAAGVATGVVAASTVVMAGIAATVVGKVTKSKELMQIGSGLSLGAGLASVATSVFGAAEGATAAAGTAAEGAAAGAAEGVSGAAGTLEAGGAIESAMAGAGEAGVTGGLGGASSAAATAGETGGLLSSVPQSSAALSASPQASFAADSSVLGLGQSAGVGAPLNAAGVSAVAAPASTTSAGISGWWKGLSEATKNKLLQVGGQAASGLMEGWSQEQKLAFERERLKLEQDRLGQQQSNANAQPRVAFNVVNPVGQPRAGLLTPQRG